MNNSQPIRILHVVTYMGRGGLETMIMNYYRHIDRTRVQFDFLVHREFRADYDDEIESLGGRIYRVPRLVPWRRNYRRTLERFFRDHPEYRIIHVHQDCLSAVCLKAAQRCGVPVRIAHAHSNSQDKNLKYLIKLFYKRQIPSCATKLFACSREAGDWMFGGAPYQVLNNAIDTGTYSFDPEVRSRVRQALALPGDAFVMGHVGRFNAVKNHGFLLEVFAEVRRKNENARLLLVGDGDLRPDMEKKAVVLGISDRVIFTGVRSDVPELMQAMDCFVFPSLYEGFPVTLVEAQASGLLCVVSEGVPRECAKTGLIRYLTLSAGPAQWAEEILDVPYSPRPDTRARLRQVGYDIGDNARWLQHYYLEQWKEA